MKPFASTPFRVAPLVCGCVGLLAWPAVAAAQDRPVENLPVVVTQGEGVVRRAPDRAFVMVTTESRSRNPKDAQTENAERMAAVQQKLRDARLPKDAIRTLGYHLDFEYDFVNGKRVPRGYVARNTIEVRVDELDRVGEVVDLAVGAGATSIGDVRFDLKDRAAVERDALRAAVADALARAEAAAAGAGRTIDRIWRIEEQGARVPAPRFIGAPMMRAEAQAAPETPITPGEIEIRAQVTLTAVLK